METLLEQPQPATAPTSNYRTAPPKGFTTATASAAGKRGAQRRRELDAIRKAYRPAATSEDATRLAHLRRLQRRCLAQANASTTGTEMHEAVKACRELFEMEMELLGRRPAKAGKGERSERGSEKPVAPSVTLPQ